MRRLTPLLCLLALHAEARSAAPPPPDAAPTHGSFRPPRRPKPPTPAHPWGHTPVDAFRAARLEPAYQKALLRDRLRARLPVALPADLPARADPAEAAALADFCLALLNRNAYVYVE